MFSFAIWDAVEHELVVVRDRSGIKPLFYAELPDGLIFASESKALEPLLSASSQPQADPLLRQLSYLWCPGPGTLHPLVQSLEPGSLLRCKSGEPAAQSRWCTPTADSSSDSQSPGSHPGGPDTAPNGRS